MTSYSHKCELILALDVPSLEEARALLNTLGDQLKWVKIGLQLFIHYGPSLVKTIADMGYQVFLDLKLHDIPNTVASAIHDLIDIPISLLTLHALGGSEMMKEAAKACIQINHPMKLLAVTVLTSMDHLALKAIGIDTTPEEQVLRLANLSLESNIQGLVCSPHELPILRKTLPSETLLATPGIRPEGTASNEQKRVMAPKEAASLGASYIVVGRPILQAKDPVKAVQSILSEIKNAE